MSVALEVTRMNEMCTNFRRFVGLTARALSSPIKEFTFPRPLAAVLIGENVVVEVGHCGIESQILIIELVVIRKHQPSLPVIAAHLGRPRPSAEQNSYINQGAIYQMKPLSLKGFI